MAAVVNGLTSTRNMCINEDQIKRIRVSALLVPKLLKYQSAIIQVDPTRSQRTLEPDIKAEQ